MEVKRVGDKIFVRLDRGEAVIEKLKYVREKYKIKNGFLLGIGALDKVKIGNYNVKEQSYQEREFEGSFEVSCLLGNIGPDKIHTHITIGDREFGTKAGHFSYGRVSGTFEIIIFVSEKPELRHKYDERTGLSIFDF